MKFDKKFWVHTATSVGIVLLGLFIYDQIRVRMAGDTSNAIGTIGMSRRLRRGGSIGAATHGPCTNPNSPLNYGALGDPCCTGTKHCSYK